MKAKALGFFSSFHSLMTFLVVASNSVCTSWRPSDFDGGRPPASRQATTQALQPMQRVES